jgi:hypothetical protein
MSGFVRSECGALFSAMLAFVSIALESIFRRETTQISLLARLPFATISYGFLWFHMVVPRSAPDNLLYRNAFQCQDFSVCNDLSCSQRI